MLGAQPLVAQLAEAGALQMSAVTPKSSASRSVPGDHLAQMALLLQQLHPRLLALPGRALAEQEEAPGMPPGLLRPRL